MEGTEIGDVIRRNPKAPGQVENGQPMTAIMEKSEIVAPLGQRTVQNNVQSDENRNKECQATAAKHDYQNKSTNPTPVANGDVEHLGGPTGSRSASSTCDVGTEK